MKIDISGNKAELGKKAAFSAAVTIKNAIQEQGRASIILATGASQFETLAELTRYTDIDWSKVTMFHLDEYIGISEDHPASFRNYLKKRFITIVKNPGAIHLLDGEAENPESECDRIGLEIQKHSIDVALVGIGENAHLAFNDPPADFNTTRPYIVVTLDEACRKQQMGEGWFDSFDQVPEMAISMSVQQIMKSKKIVCSVPDLRKAQAVKMSVENSVSPDYPASILQNHPDCTLYLDKESASMLSD